MYLLDLPTMLRVLHTHAHTCLLRAELPGGVDIQKEPCHVSIVVVKRAMVSCAILTHDEFVYATDDVAYTLLAHAGRLDWTLTLQLTSSLLSPPSVYISGKGRTLIPQRLSEPTPEQRQTWTRTQRLVFSLVNGKNSVTYIAYLLSLSTPLVEQTLSELYQMRVLALDAQKPFSLASTPSLPHLWHHA